VLRCCNDSNVPRDGLSCGGGANPLRGVGTEKHCAVQRMICSRPVFLPIGHRGQGACEACGSRHGHTNLQRVERVCSVPLPAPGSTEPHSPHPHSQRLFVHHSAVCRAHLIPGRSWAWTGGESRSVRGLIARTTGPQERPVSSLVCWHCLLMGQGARCRATMRSACTVRRKFAVQRR